MPRSYYPLTFGIMTILFSCVRFAKAIIKSVGNEQNKNEVTNRIMVIGAGSAATVLIKELKAADEGSQVVCAVDDNKTKKKINISWEFRLSGREDIEKNIKNTRSTRS